MRKTSLNQRALCLALVGAMLFPDAASAKTIPDINLGTIVVKVKPHLEVNKCGGSGGVSVTDGVVNQSSPGTTGLVFGSPAIDAAPQFHGGNTELTVWGLGWSSDIDHYITLNQGRTITWTNGDGVNITYYQTAASSTTPVYTLPVNTYETITTISASSGVPTSLLERDLDGTTRRFDVFESTGILRLALLTDKNGNTVAYTRDGQGRLTHVEDVHGRYFNLTYNPAGRVATLADSGGRSSSYAYDASGRRTGDTGPLGATAYQYDGLNRMTKITYPNGGVKNYTYDASNRVLTEDDGAGVNAQAFVYYKSSTTVTDALGRVVKYDYITLKGLKKVSKITDPAGGVTTFAYDGNLNLTSQTDPLGRVTAYTYDAKGNVTKTDDPAGGHTLASYEPNFNLVASLTDPLARTTNMTYDAQGNLTVVTDALAGTVNKGYDGQGHVTSSQDPLGHGTLFSYEPSNGALKTVTDPLSRQTAMLTDGLSRVTRNTDPSGKVTEYTYDAASNLTQVKDALNGITAYAYAPGRDKKLLQTVTDANGHATTFGYDAQGRLTSVTNALGQTKTSTYDDKGNLIQTKNARNQTISYEYNSRDLLTKKTAPEGVINYAFDAAGNMTGLNHYNGSALAISYDALNRVTQVIQTLPSGYTATIGYGYDSNGNRTSMTTPWGSFAYLYDQLNRLTRITNPQGRVFTFAYDANGRRTQLNYPNGIQTTYGYDNAGQVLSIIHKRTSDNTIIAKSTYSYDSAGNRLTMTDLAGTHSYGYDDLHRLTSAAHPAASALDTKNETFDYNGTGNRLADAQITGYTYDDANRLVENSSFTYGYNPDGDRTGQTDKLTNDTTSFTFNSENQLVSANNAKGENWTYKYDRPGRRVEKSSGTAASQKQHFIYDAENVLAILDGANNPIQVFTVGLFIDETLGVRRTDNTERYLHADAIKSTLAITDLSGTITEQYEYQSHGVPLISDSLGTRIQPESAENLILHSGRYFDKDLFIYESRFRQRDPISGFFIQEDFLGVRAGINLYAYANDNPIKYIDPLGTDKLNIDLGMGVSGEPAGIGFQFGVIIEIPSKRINPYAGPSLIFSPGWSSTFSTGDVKKGWQPTTFAVTGGGLKCKIAPGIAYNNSGPSFSFGTPGASLSKVFVLTPEQYTWLFANPPQNNSPPPPAAFGVQW